MDIWDVLQEKQAYRRRCKKNANIPDVVWCDECNAGEFGDNSWCCMHREYDKKYLQDIFKD